VSGFAVYTDFINHSSSPKDRRGFKSLGGLKRKPRSLIMSENKVRIITLEPMRVASAHGFGTEPEGIAWDKILAFVAEKGLKEVQGTRYFGFNNPNPAPGSPNYGYEQWVTVAPDVEATTDVEIKAFTGGLYAVLRCKGVEQIGQAWQQLTGWAENSNYQRSHHQWLEEVLTPPPTPENEFVFDLYMPIAK
jgi:DNA gyrase inhibitor GyrI